MGVFSTIMSPEFSELVVVLERDIATYLYLKVEFFETLGQMNEVRPFKLVFAQCFGFFPEGGIAEVGGKFIRGDRTRSPRFS